MVNFPEKCIKPEYKKDFRSGVSLPKYQYIPKSGEEREILVVFKYAGMHAYFDYANEGLVL